MRSLLKPLLPALALLFAGPVRAWVYPEHRDIAVLGIQTLDPQRGAEFDRLWKEARLGHEQRLCVDGADEAQALTPVCIVWAALPAIAGDHSCSNREMVDTALNQDWILAVADVAAQLKVDLARVPVVPPPGTPLPKDEDLPEIRDLRRRVQSAELRAERMNALRTSDTTMQRADPGYATRAGANNAHFLLPRPTVNISTVDYGKLAAEAGAEPNAIGLRFASPQRAAEGGPARQRAARAEEAPQADGRKAGR